jgi:hypothetical protein
MERYIPTARRLANRPEEFEERPEPAPRKCLPRVRPTVRKPSPDKPERKAKPEWHKAYLVPQLLKLPPIRRRGDPSEAGLEPFEFVIGGTAVMLARVKIGRRREVYISNAVQRAFDGARSKMKPGKTNRALFQRIGRETRRKARKSFSWPTIAIKIEVSRRELFRVAGLPRTVRNRHRLPAALDRLTQPLSKELPPLLRTHGEADDGYLRLEVNARWVPPSRFDCVPWPPSASGPTVLALYLFAFGTDQRQHHGRIEYGRLYKLLGIPQRDARRALGRALIKVNEHLKWLNTDGKLDKAKLPTRIALMPSRAGGFVRLELHGAQYSAFATQRPDDEQLEARELDAAADEQAA